MNQISWREYLTLTLGYCFTLLIIFFIINLLHFKFLHPKIVLHGIFLDIILTMIITSFFIKFVFVRILPCNAVFLTNACLIFFLLSSLYNVLGPTMCDRSLSVFLLIKVKNSNDIGKTITKNELIQATNLQYIRGSYMVEKRLAEQQVTGVIEIKSGAVTLTPLGRLITSIYEFFYWALDIPKTF